MGWNRRWTRMNAGGGGGFVRSGRFAFGFAFGFGVVAAVLLELAEVLEGPGAGAVEGGLVALEGEVGVLRDAHRRGEEADGGVGEDGGSSSSSSACASRSWSWSCSWSCCCCCCGSPS